MGDTSQHERGARQSGQVIRGTDLGKPHDSRTTSIQTDPKKGADHPDRRPFSRSYHDQNFQNRGWSRSNQKCFLGKSAIGKFF
jgi:hypothetical protein